jgi:hypothetical protein
MAMKSSPSSMLSITPIFGFQIDLAIATNSYGNYIYVLTLKIQKCFSKDVERLTNKFSRHSVSINLKSSLPSANVVIAELQKGSSVGSNHGG